jgi:hypothetical protein
MSLRKKIDPTYGGIRFAKDKELNRSSDGTGNPKTDSVDPIARGIEEAISRATMPRNIDPRTTT